MGRLMSSPFVLWMQLFSFLCGLRLAKSTCEVSFSWLLPIHWATVWHFPVNPFLTGTCRRKQSSLKNERLQLFHFYLSNKRNSSVNFLNEGISGSFQGFRMKHREKPKSWRELLNDTASGWVHWVVNSVFQYIWNQFYSMINWVLI